MPKIVILGILILPSSDFDITSTKLLNFDKGNRIPPPSDSKSLKDNFGSYIIKFLLSTIPKILTPLIPPLMPTLHPSSITVSKPLQYYIDCFSTLNCNKRHGQVAPHKPILLLAIMEEVRVGYITNGFIPISERLEQTFNRLWGVYVGASPWFNPKMSYPFFHLASELFWELMPKPGQTPRKEYFDTGQLRRTYFGAKIPDELCEYMQYEDSRQLLKRAIFQKYFPEFSFGVFSEGRIGVKQMPNRNFSFIMKLVS